MLHGNLGVDTAALAAPENQRTFFSKAPESSSERETHDGTTRGARRGRSLSDPFVVVVKRNAQSTTPRKALGSDQNNGKGSGAHDIEQGAGSRVELTQAQFLGQLRPALHSADPVPVLQLLGVSPNQVPWYRSASSGESITLAAEGLSRSGQCAVV